MNKFKPCPFCGRKPYIMGESSGLWKGFCIRCKCGISLGYELDRDACPNYDFPTKEEAIKTWNRRINNE